MFSAHTCLLDPFLLISTLLTYLCILTHDQRNPLAAFTQPLNLAAAAEPPKEKQAAGSSTADAAYEKDNPTPANAMTQDEERRAQRSRERSADPVGGRSSSHA